MKNLIILILQISLFSCTNASGKEKEVANSASTEIVIKGEAQGTTYTVKYLAEDYEEGLKERFDQLLNEIDLSMSTYVPNSKISRLNNGDTIELDDLFLSVYKLSFNVNIETKGAFDPTIGPLIIAWGFDFANPQKMDSAIVNSLLESSGFDQFVVKGKQMYRTNDAARINFNAVAQGYSVDVMAQMLDKMNIENYYIELGGELKVKGKNKFGDWWVIGIDRPDGKNLERNLAQRISLENSAMATSGNYRNFYEMDGKRYSHTLNPKTGYPAENSLLSATVITNDCGTADALATAFMVMGKGKIISYLEQHPNTKAYLIFSSKDGEFETYVTPNLKQYLLNN
ncbi:FAD:protein FMN transferase [Vicingaceae bacterium]|nr:FAD:protein FMN transferase [Vicingaceae bacterium]MDB4062346.1 FAD:protein FMN transferase [Vicingaceae bacterium]